MQGDLRTAFEEALFSIGLYLGYQHISDDLGKKISFHSVPAKIGLIALVELPRKDITPDKWDKIALLGTTLNGEVNAVYVFCNTEHVDKTLTKRLTRAWRAKYFKEADFYDLDEINELIGLDTEARAERLRIDLGLEEKPTGFSLSIDDEKTVVALLANQASGSNDAKVYFKNKVSQLHLPPQQANQLAAVWTGNTNVDAQKLLDWIKGKGADLQSQIPGFSVLGKVLELLAKDSGATSARDMLVLIKRYGLIRDKVALDRLEQEFGK